ncbi:hypothetical protein EDC01DRAFT_776275 [Geopyxis carbonaria]|nr:hypothetical protein EDC01DRAFT_776275 [Geopyxis carbonaria]
MSFPSHYHTHTTTNPNSPSIPNTSDDPPPSSDAGVFGNLDEQWNHADYNWSAEFGGLDFVGPDLVEAPGEFTQLLNGASDMSGQNQQQEGNGDIQQMNYGDSQPMNYGGASQTISNEYTENRVRIPMAPVAQMQGAMDEFSSSARQIEDQNVLQLQHTIERLQSYPDHQEVLSVMYHQISHQQKGLAACQDVIGKYQTIVARQQKLLNAYCIPQSTIMSNPSPAPIKFTSADAHRIADDAKNYLAAHNVDAMTSKDAATDGVSSYDFHRRRIRLFHAQISTYSAGLTPSELSVPMCAGVLGAIHMLHLSHLYLTTDTARRRACLHNSRLAAEFRALHQDMASRRTHLSEFISCFSASSAAILSVNPNHPATKAVPVISEVVAYALGLEKQLTVRITAWCAALKIAPPEGPAVDKAAESLERGRVRLSRVINLMKVYIEMLERFDFDLVVNAMAILRTFGGFEGAMGAATTWE